MMREEGHRMGRTLCYPDHRPQRFKHHTSGAVIHQSAGLHFRVPGTNSTAAYPSRRTSRIRPSPLSPRPLQTHHQPSVAIDQLPGVIPAQLACARGEFCRETGLMQRSLHKPRVIVLPDIILHDMDERTRFTVSARLPARYQALRRVMPLPV